MHDLKIDQHFATGRDAVTSAFAAGSSSLFRAFDGVRTEVSSRLKDREEAAEKQRLASPGAPAKAGVDPTSPPFSASKAAGPTYQPPQIADVRATLGNIGSGIGSFFGSRVATFRGAQPNGAPAAASVSAGSPPSTAGLRPMSLAASVSDRSLRGAGTGDRG